jgi:hypothetical protein
MLNEYCTALEGCGRGIPKEVISTPHQHALKVINGDLWFDLGVTCLEGSISLCCSGL